MDQVNFIKQYLKVKVQLIERSQKLFKESKSKEVKDGVRRLLLSLQTSSDLIKLKKVFEDLKIKEDEFKEKMKLKEINTKK